MSSRLLEVGRIVKPHGIRGEVVVDLVTDRHERVDVGTVLTTKKGPLVVRTSRPHQGKWLVVFDGYADRNRAETLAGTVLRAERVDDPEALWVDDLIGTEVVEVDGTARGRVVAVVENPAHDLLELDSGKLVPVVFIRHVRMLVSQRFVLMPVAVQACGHRFVAVQVMCVVVAVGVLVIQRIVLMAMGVPLGQVQQDAGGHEHRAGQHPHAA